MKGVVDNKINSLYDEVIFVVLVVVVSIYYQKSANAIRCKFYPFC